MSTQTAAEFNRDKSNSASKEVMDGRKWTIQNMDVGDIVIVHPKDNRKASVSCSVEAISPTGKITASAFHGGMTFSNCCHFSDPEVNNKNTKVNTYEVPKWLLYIKDKLNGGEDAPVSTVDTKPLEGKISALESQNGELSAKVDELKSVLESLLEPATASKSAEKQTVKK